jgi:hypothetical protein
MRKFDIFPKVQDDSFNIRTPTGGIITIITFLFMFIVAAKEALSFQKYQTKQQACVQSQFIKEHRELEILLNITVAFPCQLLFVNILDSSGNHQLNAKREITRQPLDPHYLPLGEPISDSDPKSLFNQCGNCYGSNYTECCHSCTDVANSFILQNRFVPNLNSIEQCIRDHKTIAEGETCRITGRLKTTFTKGQILIKPGGSVETPSRYKYDLSYFGDNVNLSHTIHTLRFGRNFKGLVNPLDNYTRKQLKYGYFFFRYSAELVPTITDDVHNQEPANQYSASCSEKEIAKSVTKKHPGIAIDFDTAPLATRFIIEKESISGFITQLCAILGGGFTLGSFIDQFLFRVNSKKHD